MVRLNHFYISMDYLKVNKEALCKQSPNGDFDIIVPNKEFASVLIPLNKILDNSETKNGVPVGTWGKTGDDKTYFNVEFRLADETYITRYESLRLIQYDALEKFASWTSLKSNKN